jgi:hypothetical protein
MNWQYRTILFEFQKDGILGDRYIDDDEMERVFNDLGRKGWELVNVTPVQEGLLSFFKRVLPQPRKQVPVKPAETTIRETSQPVRTVPHKPLPQRKTASPPAPKQADNSGRKPSGVGGIKIS